MSISPYHDLETAKPLHRGQRAYWGGLGMILIGLLAIASYFIFPAIAAPAAAGSPTATHAVAPR
ncbi:hypothetical protein EUV02_11955 [Polymorphobacter arshaanensis]|uniref:Uncharacterized protein n=1 Tax=Glacieibacterium arshaanense TaxID=2511025 RepID=A0A4Y9EKU1_9SPHN|nr:hypothetical protein [Polymorphobacter arshaanensis]TFU01026.1 hypothetical protein EUV02_11955 [Polymorphobacter arshaanensis]